jgi:hypothetical protein
MKRAHIGAVLTLTSQPSKVGQIKNPGIMSCILIRYITNDKNLEVIQPLVQEL